MEGSPLIWGCWLNQWIVCSWNIILLLTSEKTFFWKEVHGLPPFLCFQTWDGSPRKCHPTLYSLRVLCVSSASSSLVFSLPQWSKRGFWAQELHNLASGRPILFLHSYLTFRQMVCECLKGNVSRFFDTILTSIQAISGHLFRINLALVKWVKYCLSPFAWKLGSFCKLRSPPSRRASQGISSLAGMGTLLLGAFASGAPWGSVSSVQWVWGKMRQ